jgi:hypothetical protein
MSNGKKKGEGDPKNGNKHLAWAFVEAANSALHFTQRAGTCETANPAFMRVSEPFLSSKLLTST